jgi:Tfp pilus assembly protein PilF
MVFGCFLPDHGESALSRRFLCRVGTGRSERVGASDHHRTDIGAESLGGKRLYAGSGGRRLRDELLRVAATAAAVDSTITTPEISLQIALYHEVPKIVVPTVGLSVDAIVSSLRTFFRRPERQSISGDFIVRDKLLWLRLRMDGRELYESPQGADPERPDDLLVAAAPAILEEIQPYIIAASLRQADPNRALKIAGRIIAKRSASDPTVASALHLTGIIYWERRQPQRAIDVLRKAIELNPRSANFHNSLGRILHQQGERSQAVAAFRTAAAVDPTFAWAPHNLGVLAGEENKLDDAIAYFRKAIEIDPNHLSARNSLGWFLFKQDKYEEAIFQYQKAIEIDSTFVLARMNLALALQKQARHDEAIVQYREVLKIEPNNKLALENIEALSRVSPPESATAKPAE